MSSINRDALNSARPEDAAKSALQVLDYVSDHEPELQPIAIAMSLIAFTRRTGADIHDFFTVAGNMLSSKEADGPAFRAIHNYMKHEVPT